MYATNTIVAASVHVNEAGIANETSTGEARYVLLNIKHVESNQLLVTVPLHLHSKAGLCLLPLSPQSQSKLTLRMSSHLKKIHRRSSISSLSPVISYGMLLDSGTLRLV